jgi:transcriptional regulator with XRE-family HTH domain
MSSTRRDFVSDDGNGLGRAIAALREERGWKRKDLVAEAGISYPFLAEVENGNKRPSMAKLADIAAALDMTPGALMERARAIDERFGTEPTGTSGESGVFTSPERHSPAPSRGIPGPSSEVDRITSAVVNALEPRLRELVELEVRRQLDRQRGSQW